MKSYYDEYYKFDLHKETGHAPRPLFLGYKRTRPPYNSQDLNPATRYYIFKYTLRGCGLISDGARTWKLPVGSVMLLDFPNDRYRFYLEEGMDEWQGIYLEFAAGDLEAVLGELMNEYGVVYELGPESKIVHQLLAYREAYKIQGISGQEGEHWVYRNTICISGLEGSQLVYRLLTELRATDMTKKRLNHKLINAACDYINNNLSLPISIEEMAQTLSVSRGHLSRVFTDRMGRTPNRYIITAKVRLACQLLVGSKLTIEAISERIGLVSSAYFYRMFKRETGMTPKQFRSSDRQEEILRSL
jgi:AraC-like DNA-binding protein